MRFISPLLLVLLVTGDAVAGQRVAGCFIGQKEVPCSPARPPARPDPAIAERQRLEQERERQSKEERAKAAFNLGESASAKNNFTEAIRRYQSALDQLPPDSPNHAPYEGRLLAVQRARSQVMRGLGSDSRALKELRAVAADQAAGRPKTQKNVYDDPKQGAELAPLPVVAAPVGDVAAAIAQKLQIRLNFSDPRNADVKDALQRVEYTLKYNRQGAISGQWRPDRAALQNRVDHFNGILETHGISPVTLEKVEAAYTSYRLGLGQQK